MPEPQVSMNTRPVRFFHRGAVVEVAPQQPTRTVLEWLREDARCTGTKEGCAEGDCGACMVVVGSLDGQGQLALRPANACIQFLPTLDGCALFTVEDLAGAAGGLHPVQQALVDGHGSQCGFCTPGFVMSLWACWQTHQRAGTRPTRQALADALSGNLCRCTGYRPILDAGERLFDSGCAAAATGARPDLEPARQALQALQADPPLHRPGFHAPRSLDTFAALRQALPQARVLAGSTDIGLWVTKQLRPLEELIWVGGVPELQRLEQDGGWLRIGAAVNLEQAWQALVQHWPVLHELWLRFASPPIRLAGTLGGNLANGSPIGDSAPVLMALGAQLLLQRGGQLRTVALDRFYTGYQRNLLEPGEFLRAVEVPLPPAAGGDAAALTLRAYKISKRFDSDISAVCAGLALRRDAQDRIIEARLAFGGMAAVVQRAEQAEAALRGRTWDEAALQAAQAALAQDFRPLTDLRASSGYRLQVAQNLLRRFWLQTRAENPLAEQAVSVWARPVPA